MRRSGRCKEAGELLDNARRIFATITDFGRSFQKVDVGKWWLFMIAMMNRGVIPNYGPDEQWTVSTQHTKEDIETALEKFKEVAKIIKKVELELPLVEAV